MTSYPDTSGLKSVCTSLVCDVSKSMYYIRTFLFINYIYFIIKDSEVDSYGLLTLTSKKTPLCELLYFLWCWPKHYRVMLYPSFKDREIEVKITELWSIDHNLGLVPNLGPKTLYKLPLWTVSYIKWLSNYLSGKNLLLWIAPPIVSVTHLYD